MLEFLFEDVTVDVYRSKEHSDNVAVFKNTLNRHFVEKYGNDCTLYESQS